MICSPETVGGFSAAGYFFGRELHKELKQPVGLIHTSWGGTPAEAWTSPVALQENPGLEPILTRYKKALAVLPEATAKYKEDLAKWEEAVKQAKADGKQPPYDPEPPWGRTTRIRPPASTTRMIAPLIPYTIRGAIWYQGESNAGRAYQYRDLFPTMIKSWWNAWGQEGQEDFPFLFVQLANFMATKEEPGDSTWAELREAQLMTLELPNTGMAVIIDIGDAKDIHPKNKQDVGKRLALWALANTYGKDVVYSGPLYKSMAKKGNNDRPELRSRRRRPGRQGRRVAQGLRHRRRGPQVRLGGREDRRRQDRGQQRQGRRPGRRALRLGGQPRLQPVQQGGPAGLAVPHGHLARRDGRQQVGCVICDCRFLICASVLTGSDS